MGIYVKGIEMPQICEVCPLVDRFVTVDFKTITCKVTKKLRPDSCLTRPDSCPLIEVPPHGRLIDADALFNNLERTGWYDNADRDIAEDLVLAAPTVIEAEEGET